MEGAVTAIEELGISKSVAMDALSSQEYRPVKGVWASQLFHETSMLLRMDQIAEAFACAQASVVAFSAPCARPKPIPRIAMPL